MIWYSKQLVGTISKLLVIINANDNVILLNRNKNQYELLQRGYNDQTFLQSIVIIGCVLIIQFNS